MSSILFLKRDKKDRLQRRIVFDKILPEEFLFIGSLFNLPQCDIRGCNNFIINILERMTDSFIPIFVKSLCFLEELYFLFEVSFWYKRDEFTVCNCPCMIGRFRCGVCGFIRSLRFMICFFMKRCTWLMLFNRFMLSFCLF